MHSICIAGTWCSVSNKYLMGGCHRAAATSHSSHHQPRPVPWPSDWSPSFLPHKSCFCTRQPEGSWMFCLSVFTFYSKIQHRYRKPHKRSIQLTVSLQAATMVTTTPVKGQNFGSHPTRCQSDLPPSQPPVPVKVTTIFLSDSSP